MERKELRLDVLEILAGLCNSPNFWSMQKKMKGACFLLEYLWENDGVSTPGQLAALLNVSGARITAILTALQAKHFVERHVDLCDKRRVTVYLTDSGRDFVQECRAQAVDFADGVCETLGEADTAQLIRIAKKLLAAEHVPATGKTEGSVQA